MKILIDKSALVAEIDRRIKTNKECMLGLRNLDYYQGKVDALNDTLSFLDTLEVKDVQEEPVSNNLEEAAKKAGQKYFPDKDNIWARPNYEAMAAANAFKEGAQWQKKQTIEKTCKWFRPLCLQ